MFREQKELNAATCSFRVLWWRECRACHKDFFWEHSWSGWWAVDRLPRRWVRSFVCHVCAKNAERASRFLGLWKPAIAPILPGKNKFRDPSRLEKR